MTRPFIYILLLVLIVSCHQPKINLFQDATSLQDTTNEDFNFTSLDVMNSLHLPKGFWLDSTLKFERTINAEIQIILPRYESNNQFDKEVSLFFQRRLHDYTFSLDTMIHNDPSMLKSVSSAFIVNPVSVYIDNSLLSYCFIISINHAVEAHPFDEYYSFNYDLQNKKQINFFDFFNIRSKSDSSFLERKISNAIYKENPVTDKAFSHFDKLYDIDFNVEADSICFNFDDYEIGSYAAGIVKAKVDKKSLDNVIKNSYR